ncbi:MAG TPA: hypothetical protein VNC22_20475 [Sporichthya sp.]|nr:hypothetical protein [Sporichthya sp.]
MTDVAPVLNAIAEFQARGDIVYGPPGHKHGRGVDPDVLELLGRGMFAADVLSLNGFDDRTESRKVLKAAEKNRAGIRTGSNPCDRRPRPDGSSGSRAAGAFELDLMRIRVHR